MKDRIYTALGILDWQLKIPAQKDIMLVYDGPILDEAADNLLTAMLKAIDLSRNQVLVTACTPEVNQQIAEFQPCLIMVAGELTAQHLLNTKSSLESLRNQIHGYGDNKTPLIVTYHPTYLLQYPADKRKAFSDLKLIQQTLREKRHGRLPNTPEQELSNSTS